MVLVCITLSAECVFNRIKLFSSTKHIRIFCFTFFTMKKVRKHLHSLKNKIFSRPSLTVKFVATSCHRNQTWINRGLLGVKQKNKKTGISSGCFTGFCESDLELLLHIPSSDRYCREQYNRFKRSNLKSEDLKLTHTNVTVFSPKCD